MKGLFTKLAVEQSQVGSAVSEVLRRSFFNVFANIFTFNRHLWLPVLQLKMNNVHWLFLAVVIVIRANASTRESDPKQDRGRLGLELGKWKKCSVYSLEHCLCRSRSTKVYAVNCTDSQFTHSLVLKNIPLTIEVIIFTGNNIGELESPFGNCIKNNRSTRIQLRTLDLSRNKIRTVDDNSLECMPQLQVLNMSLNRWDVREHTRVFGIDSLKHLTTLYMDAALADNNTRLDLLFRDSDLPALTHLYLRNNGLQTIDARSLSPLEDLTTLDLSDNRIANVVWNASCVPKLANLILRNNSLPYLTDNVTQQLNRMKLETLDVTSNPYVCTCAMKGFYNWLNSAQSDYVVKKSQLLCSHPRQLQGLPILALNDTLFACPAFLSQQVLNHDMAGKRNVVAIGLGIVFALAVVASVLLLYINRKKIKVQIYRRITKTNYAYAAMHI